MILCEKSPVNNTLEKIAKDGKKIRFATIALNYRSEREKYNINLIIFTTFFEK